MASSFPGKPNSTMVVGPWLLSGLGTKTIAWRLDLSKRIELSGTLHESVWSDGEALRGLASFDGDLAEIANRLREGKRSATMGDVLVGPRGWGLLFVELTGRCNEQCMHCYAGSSPQVESALSWTAIEQVIRDAHALEFACVQFIGGDPLLSPDLERAVKLARELGIAHLEVFTNGLALRESLLDLFAEQRVDLAFSLYSHQAEIHDAVTRTPGSHERTSRAISRAIERGLSVRVGGVEGCVDGQNEAALRDYLAGLGVAAERIRIDRQRPVGRGVWSKDTVLLAGNGDMRHADERYGVGGKLCITYQGDIVPCIFDRRTILGNIHEGGLRHTLEKTITPATTKPHLEVVGEPLSCGDCRARRELLTELSWTVQTGK